MTSSKPDGSDKPRVEYETDGDGVATITLNRPELRNAQDRRLLYELNEAIDRAAQDDHVRVVVLRGNGPDFSSGHDLRDRTPMDEFTPITCWGGFDRPGAEGYMACEAEYYLGLCWRWRNLPKPTIAQVHGRAIAGALMLIWPCDLVVASDDAQFSDPVVAFGLNGHEYFAHLWELGARLAKEMLFTGRAISADEAHRVGMVNRVVPRDKLETTVRELARSIAARPTMGVRLAKLCVNQSLEAQGQWTAIQAAFSLHQLGHSHNMQVHGRLVDPEGASIIRTMAQGR